jgi:outer membrane protein, heavy metal efflux system
MKYLIAIILAVVSTGISFAQTDSSLNAGYGLGYLIDNAVNKNSKLEAIDIQKRIELTRKEQTGRQPMPMFEAMVDYIPFDFMAKPEYDAFYSQKLMIGKLNDMSLMSKIKASKQDISKDVLRIDLIRQIKQNYFELYYLERLLAFNLEYQKIMKNIIRTLESNYASGMGSQSQILKSGNEVQMLEFEQIDMTDMKKLKINNLRVLANMNLPDDFSTKDVPETITTISDLDSNKLFVLMIKNNPEFRMLDNMLEETRLEKKIAENDRIPDITLRGGIKYMANVPMTFMTFGIGVDLPFMPWNTKRINAAVEEKTLTEKQVGSNLNSTLVYMKNELNSMIIMLNTIKKKYNYISEVLVPQTQQTFNSTLITYSSESGEFMNLLDSYRKMRETDQMLVKEETDYLKQVSELEFLIGKNITKINN